MQLEPKTPEAPVRQDKPGAEVARSNLWYVDDQFAAQLGSPGRRSLVEGRWDIFRDEISQWATDGGVTSAQPLKVLDAGCGDGINLVGLRRAFDGLGLGADLFGTDYNTLRTGRSNTLGAARGICSASLLCLPFDDATFDVILCNHVLEHIPEDAAAIAELHRVLRPGGLMLVGVPNEGCALARLRNNVLQPSILRTTDHLHFHTRTSLRSRLEGAGLRVGRIHGEGFFFPHLRAMGFLIERGWGRRAMEWARTIAPGQAAGLIAVARRDS